MRATASLIPALLITLGLLYLMQFMVSGQSQRISRLEDYGVVDFVRLHREPEKPITSPPRRPRPSSPADTAPPTSPELANVEPATPTAPDLTAEFPQHEQPSVDAKPYLGPLPVKAPKPVAAVKPRIAVKKPAKPAPGRNTAIRKPNKTALASLPKSRLGGQPGAVGGTDLGVPGAGGAGDGNLIPLFKMAPQYPRKAAVSGKEGWVKVAFTITKRGTVTNAVVVESKPRRVFNRSALKAIRKWRFKPQVIDGKPVPVRATQVIEFKLASK